MLKDKGKVLLVDDDEFILSSLSRMLHKTGYEVRTANSTGNLHATVRTWVPQVILLDNKLPEKSGVDILRELREQDLQTPVIMLTADNTAETAVKAMKLGAADYLTKPVGIHEIKMVLRNVMEKERLRQEVSYLRKVSAELLHQEIIGEAREIQELKSKIEKIARSSVLTILITGESGTGKELFARYAHRCLHGSGFAPFIQINCASLPENLLENELFGHEKGAFTDARTDKRGLFELANGGTILLDEIGDMQPNLQAKLLRVLEERTIRHLGGSEEIPLDCMVVSTTNKDLAQSVKAGSFRRDLFFRLNTFHLSVPPLRERKEDIPLLARNFLRFFSTRYNNRVVQTFSPAAEARMAAYDWPGNIRELRNVIERIIVLEGADAEILPEHLPEWLHSSLRQGAGDDSLPPNTFVLPEEGISLEALEGDMIRQALIRTKHNKAKTAKLLHLSYETLRYQVRKFGLE